MGHCADKPCTLSGGIVYGMGRETTRERSESLVAIGNWPPEDDHIAASSSDRGQVAPGPVGNNRRCDNPACLSLVRWTGERGRPSRYCSDRCRQATTVWQARLSQRAADLTATLKLPTTYRKRRVLQSELARLSWWLSAYPRSEDD